MASLKRYRKKRGSGRTPEPSGKKGSKKRSGGPIFVIQKHDASQLHNDLRLEVEGVLASWAVPKGPSTDPREKRLARKVEDHPLDYAEFEGVIPEEEYGGGTVLVWDKGTYRNTTEEDGEEVSMAQALREGHATFVLKGKKLRGGYALTRTKRGKDSQNWLLVKMKDDHADARRNPVSTEPKSVLSNRTLRQIADDETKKSG